MRTFFWRTNLANGVQSCQAFGVIWQSFGEIQLSCLSKFNSFIVGKNNWQIFCQALCAQIW